MFWSVESPALSSTGSRTQSTFSGVKAVLHGNSQEQVAMDLLTVLEKLEQLSHHSTSAVVSGLHWSI